MLTHPKVALMNLLTVFLFKEGNWSGYLLSGHAHEPIHGGLGRDIPVAHGPDSNYLTQLLRTTMHIHLSHYSVTTHKAEGV